MSTSPPFRHPFRVQLHDTDAAGVMFFAHLFRHAHDAYEAFMAALGLPLERLIQNGAWHLPLIHAEADYKAPLRHGDEVLAEVVIERIGQASFTLAYRFARPDGQWLASARTVHACVAAGEATGHPLPDELRELLAKGPTSTSSWAC